MPLGKVTSVGATVPLISTLTLVPILDFDFVRLRFCLCLSLCLFRDEVDVDVDVGAIVQVSLDLFHVSDHVVVVWWYGCIVW